MEKRRIIDAHVHQWDLRNTPREATTFVKLLGWNPGLMHWLAGKAFPREVGEFFGGPREVLADYLPRHHEADTEGRDVAGFVHVEASWRGKGAMGPVAETRWLESLETPRLKAIVGFADLKLGDSVAGVLEAHLAASSRFRGVRYPLAHHPQKGVWSACEAPALMADSTWRRGFAQLGKLGLSFDATVYHHQLDDLHALAADFPDIEVVVCHAGTPTAYGGTFGGAGRTAQERAAVAEAWRSSMDRLAELPNVNVKLSGLAMPILGWGYHHGAIPDAERVAEDFQPIVDFLIDRFGASRCMFASNFPVDRISMPWATLYDAYGRMVATRSVEDREALFYGTASRIYRLEASDAP